MNIFTIIQVVVNLYIYLHNFYYIFCVTWLEYICTVYKRWCKKLLISRKITGNILCASILTENFNREMVLLQQTSLQKFINKFQSQKILIFGIDFENSLIFQLTIICINHFQNWTSSTIPWIIIPAITLALLFSWTQLYGHTCKVIILYNITVYLFSYHFTHIYT